VILDAETLRLEQADKIMQGIERCLRAGHQVTFEPDGANVVVTVAPAGSRRGVAISKREARDAAGHVLTIAMVEMGERESASEVRP
jgi:hypothetical protein